MCVCVRVCVRVRVRVRVCVCVCVCACAASNPSYGRRQVNAARNKKTVHDNLKGLMVSSVFMLLSGTLTNGDKCS